MDGEPGDLLPGPRVDPERTDRPEGQELDERREGRLGGRLQDEGGHAPAGEEQDERHDRRRPADRREPQVHRHVQREQRDRDEHGAEKRIAAPVPPPEREERGQEDGGVVVGELGKVVPPGARDPRDRVLAHPVLHGLGNGEPVAGIFPEGGVHADPDDEEENRGRHDRARAGHGPAGGSREGGAGFRAARRGRRARQAPEPVGNEENARHVGVLLGDARKGERGRGGQQPAGPVGLEKALKGDDRRQGEDQRVEVFTDEPREVPEVRREQNENRVGDGGVASDPAPQGERERDEEEAEGCGHHARRGVRGAEDLVDESVDVIEKRAVIRGVVPPVAAPGERPGLVGVDRLVVVEGPVAERPEARHEGERGEEQERRRRAPRHPAARARDGSRVVQGVLPSFSVEIELVPELTT